MGFLHMSYWVKRSIPEERDASVQDDKSPGKPWKVIFSKASVPVDYICQDTDYKERSCLNNPII